ncbi:MAG: hypothetical protein L3J41_07330 [Melioribacteraceae bacterium]|nr:hypothetical protein [Melioribacteraceae bacterium]
MSQLLKTRISDTLSKELDNLSEETNKTKTFHVNKALEVYIHQYSDLQIALDRLHNKNDEVISNKKMVEILCLNNQ